MLAARCIPVQCDQGMPKRISRRRCIVRASCRSIKIVAPEADATDLEVLVMADAAKVSEELCAIVTRAAHESIQRRGSFSLAVPGGSVLKMCAGLSSASIDWTKTTLFFVNHKTVSNDDDLATYRKAQALFLDTAKGCTVHTLGGSSDAAAEAKEYDQRLRAAMQSGSIATCPKSSNPSFDLMLLGVGSDGHVGSLYPSRPEVEIDDGRFVLPVVKGGGGPASVTLSLPVMNAARRVVIALTGEKKAAAVRQALEEAPPPGGFPAQQVKARSRTWLLDAGAASGLAAVAALRDLH